MYSRMYSLSTAARRASRLPDPREYHPPPMDQRTIVVLEGDETGQELLEEGLRTLAPDVIVSQVALLVAVQAQPVGDVTATVSVPPSARKDLVVGATVRA